MTTDRMIKLKKLVNEREDFNDLTVEEMLLICVMGTSKEEVRILLDITDWDKLETMYRKRQKKT